MFHSKRLGKKINALHERALKITYGYISSPLNELLEKDNSVSINHKNVQPLATEMYKVSNNMSPTILNPLSANPTKWSNTLKQFAGKSRRIL